MGNSKPSIVAFIYYPDEENTFEKLCEKIKNAGINSFISPLHQPDDENLKEHYHVVCVRQPRQGFELATWQGYCKYFGGANGYVLIPNSPCGYIRYLLHIDNPEKEQFTSPVTTIGDIDYKYYSDVNNFKSDVLYKKKHKHDIESELIEIYQFVSGMQLFSYANLIDIILAEHQEWFYTATKNSAQILAYMRSMEYRIKHDYKFEDKTLYSDIGSDS